MKKLPIFAIVIATLLVSYCKKDDVSGPVTISISDVTVDEGNEYATINIQLKLDATADEQITAYISSTDGTAEANKDYIPFTDEPVVFAKGELQKDYQIIIAGDRVFEEDESFQVTIKTVDGPATIGSATGSVNLINDDNQGPQSVPITPTIDWQALVGLAPGATIPYEVFNFGQPDNIPNAEFTSVAAVGDTLFFEPRINPVGDTILYYELTFNPDTAEEYLVDLSEPVSPGDDVFLAATILVNGADELEDLEFKYDLYFYIGRNNGERVGPYVIDPKIRVPSSQ